MKVLVVPDVHLKPWMFQRAAELLREKVADIPVCLMDIPDDWGKQLDLELYDQTFDAAIRFAREFLDGLWCYGNHDVCYLWDKRESGYSRMASWLVCEKLRKLSDVMLESHHLAYLQRIDDVIFSHGGLGEAFVRQMVPAEDHDDIDKVVNTVNGLGSRELWQDLSPLWLRPQDHGDVLYGAGRLLQVVGHTPVEKITKEKDRDLISCDVFSTYPDGAPVGSQEFLVIDTKTHEFHGVK